MPSLLRVYVTITVLSTIIFSTNAATSFDYILAPGKNTDHDFTYGDLDVGLRA